MSASSIGSIVLVSGSLSDNLAVISSASIILAVRAAGLGKSDEI